MTRFVSTLGVVLAAPVLLALAAPAGAQSRCTAARYQAVGKLVLADAKCAAKAAKRGEPVVDLACTDKAEARFAKRWARSERKGDCEQPGVLAGEFAGGLTLLLIAGEIAREVRPPPALCCFDPAALFPKCGWVPDEATCIALPATVGDPGTVCDGPTGVCAATPARTAGCCQDLDSFEGCVTGPGMDAAECSSEGGRFFPEALCLPSGSCSPPVP